MEINKQLFEDVLSGKLKGTFVTRDGNKYDSSNLRRNTDKRRSYDYPYMLYIGNYTFSSHTTNGKISICLEDCKYDIVDFIPDTDMKENELTIEIPEGKEIDWDESKKQNKVVLKDKQLTYKDICEKLLIEKSYFITNESTIHPTFEKNQIFSSNCAFTQHQLECILAKNKLANVAVYLNDGWKPTDCTPVWIIDCGCYLKSHTTSIHAASIAFDCFGLVIFKSKELAQQAIEILGEETVKLALEPLGI